MFKLKRYKKLMGFGMVDWAWEIGDFLNSPVYLLFNKGYYDMLIYLNHSKDLVDALRDLNYGFGKVKKSLPVVVLGLLRDRIASKEFRRGTLLPKNDIKIFLDKSNNEEVTYGLDIDGITETLYLTLKPMSLNAIAKASDESFKASPAYSQLTSVILDKFPSKNAQDIEVSALYEELSSMNKNKETYLDSRGVRW